MMSLRGLTPEAIPFSVGRASCPSLSDRQSRFDRGLSRRSREARDRLDPGSKSGVTNDRQAAGPTDEIASSFHSSQ